MEKNLIIKQIEQLEKEYDVSIELESRLTQVMYEEIDKGNKISEILSDVQRELEYQKEIIDKIYKYSLDVDAILSKD